MQLKFYLGMSLLALAAGTPLPAWTAPQQQVRDSGAQISATQLAHQHQQNESAASAEVAWADALTVAAHALAARPVPAIAIDLLAQSVANDFIEVPVAQDQLDHLRGGTDTVSNNANLNGMVTGNTAINVNTGSNIIDGGAFANSAGVPIVVQNSGSNVLIQNSTIINLQLK